MQLRPPGISTTVYSLLASQLCVKCIFVGKRIPDSLQIFFTYLCKTLNPLVRKFFQQDKNYLLEDAQLRAKDRLLTILIDKAVATYQRVHNPLGLNDAFSEKIARYYPRSLVSVYAFYENLAGIYRFKYGENQLGFLWDGRDHSEKYEEDWLGTFDSWTDELCQEMQFAQAVLDLTVFLPENGTVHLAENRMNAVMVDRFEVRFHKQKGIVRMNVA